ncbi:FtsX-like permease family protein [Streptomyces griseochromogenes]|uniref:FtsX-like permease family protein n=1 Tax=Streptomyces griseochromogenes TaxID=68214 RepID=UPI003793A52C
MSGLTAVAVRQIRTRPSRLLLTGCTLLVTAFFLAGSAVFTATLKRQVTDELSPVAEGTDVVVAADGTGDGESADAGRLLDDARLKRLRALDGVSEVQPVATGSVLVKGAGRSPYPLVGTALSGTQSVVRVLRGTLPHGPGEVALTSALGDRPGLHVGSRITVVAETQGAPRPLTVTVSAVVQAPAALGAALLTTPVDARSWLHTRGWQQALVRGDGRPATQVLSEVRAALGARLTARTGAELRAGEGGNSWIGTLSALLTAFVVVALLAGAVIVSTTYRVLLVRDQRRLALLRCVGARPGQVLRSVLAQAAFSGLVAGVLGALAAVGCAAAVTAAARLGSPAVPVPSLLGCVLVSVLTSVAAAAPAARAAARIPPVAALSTAAVRDVPDRIGRTRAVTGWLCLTGASLCAAAATGGGDVAVIGAVASGTAAFGGLLTLGPALVRRTAAAGRRPVRAAAGLAGTLALRNLSRAARRTAACAVVLSLGLTMVSTVLVTLASVQHGMDRRLAHRDPVDAVVAVPPTGRSVLTPAVVDAVRDLPETAAVVTVAKADGEATGARGRHQEGDIHGIDPSAVPALLGRHSGQLRPGRAALSATMATALGTRAGERISLRTPDASFSVRVSMIHPDTSEALGDVALLPQDFAHLAPNSPTRALYITAVDRSDPASLRAPLDTALPLDPSLHLSYPGEERRSTQQSIDRLRLLALGLVSLTILVALVGVAVTLTLSVTERTGENGVLRAIGMTGSGLRSVLAWEAALVGLYAAVPGLALGIAYGLLLFGALPDLGSATIPYGQLILTLLAAPALALAASVLPASRSASVSPMLDLRTE